MGQNKDASTEVGARDGRLGGQAGVPGWTARGRAAVAACGVAMWLALTLTLVSPLLMLGLVLLMGMVEDFVEGSREPWTPAADVDGGSSANSYPLTYRRHGAQVIRLDRAMPQPREPQGGRNRPIAQ